jgi:hypothetical protein
VTDDGAPRGMARWPEVTAVFGWLALDRRGNWLLKEPGTGRFGRIGNAALREFIARNYAVDARGRWFCQNGPQRVYVNLAYTPFVVHYEGEALFDQCGRAVNAVATYLDDEGSVLVSGQYGVGLLDDRDLERHAEAAERMMRIARSDVETRFGFVSNPEIPCASPTSSL